MNAVPYGLLADVDVSSHPHVPSNGAGRGCSCLQGLSFNETIFTWVCLLRSTRSNPSFCGRVLPVTCELVLERLSW